MSDEYIEARVIIDVNKVSIACTIATLSSITMRVDEDSIEHASLTITGMALSKLLVASIGTDEALRLCTEQHDILEGAIERMTDPEALAREVNAYLKNL